jgi:hypothetical protein
MPLSLWARSRSNRTCVDTRISCLNSFSLLIIMSWLLRKNPDSEGPNWNSFSRRVEATGAANDYFSGAPVRDGVRAPIPERTR